MSIISSFGELYDRTLDPAFANYTVTSDAFEVDEHDTNPGVKTKHLLVQHTGADYVSFNHNLVKGMSEITTKRSGYLLDSDCDGVTFVSSPGQDGLIFSELKSTFSTQKLFEAFQQMTHSFLKMHSILSLCKDYAIDGVSLHFIAACQCFEDKNQEDGVYNQISKEEQLGGKTFAGKFLRKLIEHKNVTVKFSKIMAIYNLPLSQALANKDITLSLQMTKKYNDRNVVYTY